MNIRNIFFSVFNKRTKKGVAFIFGCPRGGTTYLWSLIESNVDTIPFLNGKKKDQNNQYPTSESGVYIRQPKEAKRLIEEFIAKNRSKLVFEKTPMHTLKHTEILRDFPQAKVIVIYRNPIAIVNSIVQSSMDAFKNETLSSSVLTVKKYYAQLNLLSKRENAIILSYESLLEKPEKTLQYLFERLGISVADMDHIIQANYKTSKISVKGVLRKGESSSFKNDMSEENYSFLKKELSHELEIYTSING